MSDVVTTNVQALQAACDRAVQQHWDEVHEREATEIAETLSDAQQYAVQVLGEDAARALGEWLPVDAGVSPEDTVQAAVQISRGVQLIYSCHSEDGPHLSLLVHCAHCGTVREPRITSLFDLADQMRVGGLR